jgi:hypothetical protein
MGGQNALSGRSKLGPEPALAERAVRAKARGGQEGRHPQTRVSSVIARRPQADVAIQKSHLRPLDCFAKARNDGAADRPLAH